MIPQKSSRRLRRFFSPHIFSKEGEEVCLHKSETHHLQRVLRLRPGDACLVTDGMGHEARAFVLKIDRGEAVVKLEKLLSKNEAFSKDDGVQVFVALALPQRGKMDFLVEKLQELGVAGIFLMETERTMIKMSAENKTKAVARWEKISRESAKQSGSLRLMTIEAPRPYTKILEQLQAHDENALFDPLPDTIPFAPWFLECKERFAQKKIPTPLRANLLFGPEGGFSERELELARQRQDLSIVSLGARVLKLDTAVLAVSSIFRLMLS